MTDEPKEAGDIDYAERLLSIREQFALLADSEAERLEAENEVALWRRIIARLRAAEAENERLREESEAGHAELLALIGSHDPTELSGIESFILSTVPAGDNRTLTLRAVRYAIAYLNGACAPNQRAGDDA